MADQYLAGKSGSVLVGGVAYAFGKWKIAMNTKLPTVTNFTTAGFQKLVAAITKGTITLDGPYNAGNMPLTCGTSYVFTLNFTNSLGIVVTALVGDITPTVDVEGAQVLSVTAESDGTFTAAVT